MMPDEMSEKHPLLQARPNDVQPQDHQLLLAQLRDNVVKAQRDYMQACSQSPSYRLPRLVMLATILLVSITFCGFSIFLGIDALMDAAETYPSSKVALEAHIMSKCPDARDCLREMILPAMVNVSDKVDFRLSYIGSITEHDDGVLCKHGPQECLGNIIELCAAKLYPNPIIYLGFTMCLTKTYQDIPKQELVEDCALEHGINFEKLNKCTTEDDGEYSLEMLQNSFRRSAAANVSTSCTVRVDEEVFCIRDDGVWKDCPYGHKVTDLVDAIDRRYNEKNE